MATGLTYEQARKKAWMGFFLLLVVTIVEVFVALLGSGHIVDGFYLPKALVVLIMVGLGMYKAYYIVKEFMHLGYEVRSMGMTVVLPTLLLVWAIIAFLWEGDTWLSRRAVTNTTPVPVEVKKAPETAPVSTEGSDKGDAEHSSGH